MVQKYVYIVIILKSLKTKDLPFEKIYIDEDDDAKDYIVKQGFKTVPQIWLDDNWIGGYDDLVRFLNK